MTLLQPVTEITKRQVDNQGSSEESMEILNQQENKTSTSSMLMASPTMILQMLAFPFTMIIHLLSIMKHFFSHFNVITVEQEDIMRETPGIQKNLEEDMRNASIEQKKIGKDIEDLKERLARLEERKRQRLEAMKALNYSTS
jgi:hypothetical protein